MTEISIDFVLIACAAGCLILALIFNQKKTGKNSAPGPIGFPILGHLPNLGLEPYKTAANWKSKYGPIVSVNFGSFPTIIISDYKLAKEAYAIPEFCGRPKFALFSRRSGGQPEGLAFTSGISWREQRGFAHKRLKQLGFGRRTVENVIVEQVQELIENLTPNSGVPMKTHGLFNIAFWNTTWGLLAGKPFKQTDPIIKKFTHLVVDGFSDVNIFSMLSMLVPWFGRNFPNFITQDKRLDEIFVDSIEMLQPFIDEHWKSRSPGQPRDFIDAYIDEIENPGSGPSFHGDRGKHGLICTLLDLFVAGIETTGTTMGWVCLLLAKYTHVQDKVVKEIRSVIGERLPSLQDRISMPYTEAVLHEIMRYRTIVPLSVFHSTIEDVHFHGYDIPKDTMVYINLWEAHNNKELWGDAENFRPERWLSEDGLEFRKKEGFLAFSTGKRVCLGEQLARDEMFLFMACLFQKMSVGLRKDRPEPSLEPKLGGSTLAPREHEIIFSVRS